jgi:hypothetical protein
MTAIAKQRVDSVNPSGRSPFFAATSRIRLIVALGSSTKWVCAIFSDKHTLLFRVSAL